MGSFVKFCDLMHLHTVFSMCIYYPRMRALICIFVPPHRLVMRDSHQLFQRLESQAQEYVLEAKVRLLKQMSTGLKTPQQARQFVSMLLDEYALLCMSAKKQASFLHELVGRCSNRGFMRRPSNLAAFVVLS